MIDFKIPKKLIETALPLDAINSAAAKEKSIRFGHPGALHLWWARRPLAAARAVLFAQAVNDPGYERSLGRGLNKEAAQKERARLFGIIERLVQWETANNEGVLSDARREIWKSWRETCELNRNHPKAGELFNPEILPSFYDPFAGGGIIPLAAQHLGFESYCSDLNPVAVILNKATIEIPQRFQNLKPVFPKNGSKQGRLIEEWVGARGLAEDIKDYGKWLRDEAKKKLKEYYPDVLVTDALVRERPELRPVLRQTLPVVAWLWARTIKCPNPACNIQTPLLSSFAIGTKDGKEAYLHVTYDAKEGLHFTVRDIPPKTKTSPSDGLKRGTSGIFECINCGTITTRDYTSDEACTHGTGTVQIATVCDSELGRIYLDPNLANPKTNVPKPTNLDSHDLTLAENPRDVWCRNFGLVKASQLFTDRQLFTLATLSDLVGVAIERCKQDAIKSGMSADGVKLSNGGTGADAYAEAVGVYLGLCVDKTADYNSSLVVWSPSRDQAKTTFSRQALPMVWDFAEVNPFGEAAGDFEVSLTGIVRSLQQFSSAPQGSATQADARSQNICVNKVVSTDPPYYDNIGYSDLSDFFYFWLKRSLGRVYPNLLSGATSPKANELVATSYRHENRDAAEQFFLDGMTSAMANLAEGAHPAFPVTIYYAFKQAETRDNSGTVSTGWVTFLDAVLKAGFSISGTWPMRTERDSRSIGIGTNALASSVILVCKRRDKDAGTISRREFLRELNATLPDALTDMTMGGVHSPVAPVDLSQAIIGPGMSIFSKYSAVLEADGKPMSVETALLLINRFLAEDDFDHDTQFCLQWFDQYGWASGKFGDADVLARAKGTSVDGLRDGGVVESSSGTLRLLKPSDLSSTWMPESDMRISIWEILHQMIARFYSGGEDRAGELLARVSNHGEAIRTLAYRLYTTCERKGWAQDAGSYDGLVRAWDSIESAARSVGYSGTQISLFDSTPSTNESQNPTKAKSRKKK